MPLFLIERNFAEDVSLDSAGIHEVRQINDEVGVNWLFSFLSADKRKSYCLYEAPSEEAIRIAARRANLPADVIVPVSSVPIAEFPAAKYSVFAPAGRYDPMHGSDRAARRSLAFRLLGLSAGDNGCQPAVRLPPGYSHCTEYGLSDGPERTRGASR